VTLPPNVPVAINTLENVLYKARMNDISFTIGGALVVLIEHQSTINENMPLRLLLYIAKLYEKITGEKDLYRQKRISLPQPEFIVLYNGMAPCPDEKILSLSDSFHDRAELGLARDTAFLELTAKVYNINRGHNEPIVRRCKTLEGYSAFIAAVREHEGKGNSRDEAIKLAVKDCIERNILKEFLETHATEVANMLITEWNWDDAFVMQREEGRQEGREEDVKRLRKYGMLPEQIAEALELPLDTVHAYLKAE
jgi:predicted transposase/invertase (TIGR01784 family)